MVTLACGYVSLTKIVFANENITAEIEAKTGEVAFYDAEAKNF